MNNSSATPIHPIKLYRYKLSGHCHRVELMMSLLNLPIEIIELNRDGSNLPENFNEISPFGQVPVIDDNGITLSDSNAILVYLTKKYSDNYNWLPDDPFKAAQVQRWFSVAAGELTSGPAIARFSKVFDVELDYKLAKEKSLKLLDIMNVILNKHDFLTGDEITLADIACYTYVAHAPEGGISLEKYLNIQAWLKRIKQQKGFIAMTASSIPE